MPPVEFHNAFYIKLGRGGCWEADSIENSRLRLGWSHQSVDDINYGRWEIIATQLRVEHEGKPPQVATNDLNRLHDILDGCESAFSGSRPKPTILNFVNRLPVIDMSYRSSHRQLWLISPTQ